MTTLGEQQSQEIKLSYTKLLETVGSSLTFDELLNITNENDQNNFWLNTYNITDSQFIEWFEYVLKTCREIMPECDEHLLVSFICNMIKEWHFPVIED